MNISNANTPTVEQLRSLIIRFGLVAGALTILLSFDKLRQSETVTDLLPVWLTAIELIVAFFMLILAARRSQPRWASWLILVVVACITINHLMNYETQNTQRGGALVYDTYIFPEYAAQVLRAGANPYHYDMLDSLRVFMSNPAAMTRYLHNDFYGGIQHPALSFLLLVPFQALNIPTHLVYVLFFLLAMGVIFWGTPEPLRPLILLPFLFYSNLLTLVLWGSIDIVWATLLLLMIVMWRRVRWRAVLFGLAFAYKVQPLLLLPFMLVRLWHETSGQPGQRVRVLGEFVIISALTFALINAPFTLWDFSAWFTQTTSNYVSDFTIFGIGLARLMVANIMIVPKSIFLLLMLLVLGAALVLYYRHFERWREALWIVPGITLLFASHSLDSYWLFWILPLLFALMREQTVFPLEREPLHLARRWKLSAALLVSVCVVGVGVVGWYIGRPNPISIEIQDFIRASGTDIKQLNIRVTNDSDYPLTPRFSMVDAPFFGSAFWRIDEGVEVIEPGERASFTISREETSDFVNILHGAQVVVTDAYRYDLRAAATIKPDVAPYYVSAVPNGDYRFWRETELVPLYWTLQTSIDNPDALQLIETELGERGLRLTLPTMQSDTWNYVRLNTEIVFPHSTISVWVKPPLWANTPPDFDRVYGIELLANGHRVWVLFGDEARQGKIDDTYYWMISAPRDTWSHITLDLRQIYADLGLTVDDLDLQPVSGVKWVIFPRTALKFGWLIVARNQPDGTLQAEVGTVTNDALLPDRAEIAREAVAHPERVLLWRAEHSRLTRNYDLAVDYVQQVLALKPDEARAYIQLGWTQFDMGSDAEAEQSFEQAQTLLDAQPERYSSYNQASIYAGQAWLLLRQKECFPAALLFEQARTTFAGYPFPEEAVTACGSIFNRPDAAEAQ